ncbi:uncharacterized protein GVI51_A03949 [Nakaseomyces glabratus]|uniref:PRELI/MSF1 domain-containing protein n=2 Tax=Candida glabrata TaxID=5478 RepID=Q6FY90_CANGA|nr:uncharacterized protein CAGL0A04103g [Nakaseomyces glabratus]KAH7591473.1 PRELI/MSF1 domain profile [Nakaseomyces glabratus]KAH7591922.1 PRELI/MSF1 domain profile [Nakaseomyces glabratus]KAH7598953.1 PRELI/MSF1 domain profile [Nakaseomyces glabratus]KAH7609400.1 PRELI/MSF1 domain profile [Nakaseomyces glabratus]KAH7609809.1 PRELI/MSF1 domain profile [Nakaseomyces glabratus]|eukprot:XP_444945.1 uncharacterized protein CAGL0A04103g [[Candida] glabrata]
MVLVHRSVHVFENDFASVSCAFFNRYPNPYSRTVKSIDTLNQQVLDGKLHTTRLLRKTGNMPVWARPFLGRISESWVIEVSVVDPQRGRMETFTKNLDHTRIMQVEEYSTYDYNFETRKTSVVSRVKFSSGFTTGLRERLENWSRSIFDENVKYSRQGMLFVMKKIEEKRNKRSLLQQIQNIEP